MSRPGSAIRGGFAVSCPSEWSLSSMLRSQSATLHSVALHCLSAKSLPCNACCGRCAQMDPGARGWMHVAHTKAASHVGEGRGRIAPGYAGGWLDGRGVNTPDGPDKVTGGKFALI